MLVKLSKYALILFILVVAIAAFGHSAWVISTMFGGKEPPFDPWIFGAHFNWMSSGWLVAFALDFGMFVISHDIQDNRGNGWKWVAFIVLSVFTYTLQLTYMAIHKDPVALGGGVKPEAAGFAQFILDYGLYWFPLMLPLSTAIYTLAYREKKAPEDVKIEASVIKNQPIPEDNTDKIVPIAEPDVLPTIEAPKYPAVCPYCDFNEEYDTIRKSQVNLTRHINKEHPNEPKTAR